MAKREKAIYLIQSVTHALEVLEELSKQEGELGVTELAKRLKLHKNNIFRLLATLELKGFVEQSKSSNEYRLGAKCLALGQSFLNQSTLLSRALPRLEEIAEQTGETAGFATIANNTVQYPLSVESKFGVRVPARRACEQLEATSTLIGKLLQDSAQTILSEADEVNGIFTCVARINGLEATPIGAIEVRAPLYRVNREAIIQATTEGAKQLSFSLGEFESSQKRLAEQIEVEVTSEQIVQKRPKLVGDQMRLA